MILDMSDNSKDSRKPDTEAVWQQPNVMEWVQLLLNSYRQWLTKELIDRAGTFLEQSKRLFESSLIVVSHGLEDDPILNYGNQKALILWEMDWSQFTHTPSRLTAEPINQAERAEMLRQAKSHGYIDNYRGIRISKTGKRFLVERAIVWNVVDSQGLRHGQAATFSTWSYVDATHS